MVRLTAEERAEQRSAKKAADLAEKLAAMLKRRHDDMIAATKARRKRFGIARHK
jgi:hypothetical protein